MNWIKVQDNKFPVLTPLLVANPKRNGYEYDTMIFAENGIYSDGEFYEGFEISENIEYYAIIEPPQKQEKLF